MCSQCSWLKVQGWVCIAHPRSKKKTVMGDKTGLEMEISASKPKRPRLLGKKNTEEDFVFCFILFEYKKKVI